MSDFLSKTLTADDANSFWELFNKQCTGVQVGITELGVEDIVPMKKHLVKLQAFATDCTDLLPSYDIKRAQGLLDEVGRVLRDREEQLKPKKKFRFKSRDNMVVGTGKGKKTAAGSTAAADGGVLTAEEVAAAEKAKRESDDTSYGVCDRKDETITLSKETIGEANGVIRSLLIKGCKNTVVYARCVLGSVRIEECENCSLYLGPTQTSVYLNQVTGTTAYVAAHQLRIHECKDCKLCVRCNSHPIVEDCQGMGFAPYDVEYPAISAHFGEASLREARCWDNVVDFRWHRTTASPNWHVLTPKDRPQVHKVSEEDGTVTVWGSSSNSGAAAQISAKQLQMSAAETVFKMGGDAATEADAGAGGDSDDDEL